MHLCDWGVEGLGVLCNDGGCMHGMGDNSRGVWNGGDRGDNSGEDLRENKPVIRKSKYNHYRIIKRKHPPGCFDTGVRKLTAKNFIFGAGEED